MKRQFRSFKVPMLPKSGLDNLSVSWVDIQKRLNTENDGVAVNHIWLYAFEAPSYSEQYEERFKIQGTDKDLTHPNESRELN